MSLLGRMMLDNVMGFVEYDYAQQDAPPSPSNTLRGSKRPKRADYHTGQAYLKALHRWQAANPNRF